ncbi:hypothetical protein AAK894_06150 [Lachnospiraceae bacterium 46-61]
MKKNLILLYYIILLFLISGCSDEKEQPTQQTTQQEIQQETKPAVLQQQKMFGTYDVYEDWVFVENNSNEQSAFYCKKGEEITNKTTNIFVEYRQNQYKKEEYDVLTSAILYQLKLELKQELYQNLISESFTSQNGYSVFRIEVNDEQSDTPVRTVQYYIAGEKAHILVQITDFGEQGTENVEEAAKNIVDSFVWREITI